MMNDECNKLFDELWCLSDEPEQMNSFVKAIEKWVDFMGGNVRISLINLHTLNNSFPKEDLYIAYDDCSGAMNTEIFTTSDFIKYIQSIYNDVTDEDLEEFWIEKLNGIVN